MKSIKTDIIQKQINHLIELGFPKLLKLSTREYLDSFPIIGETTFSEYKNRFDFPVLVDTRIPYSELISKANINNYLKPEEITNFSNDFSYPYIYFTHDSKKYSSHTAAIAINKFAEDEEGCTLQEIIFLYLHYPILFEGIAMDAILTDFRQGDYHPCILKVTAKAEIGAHWHNDLTVGINILSKGKRLYKFILT